MREYTFKWPGWWVPVGVADQLRVAVPAPEGPFDAREGTHRNVSGSGLGGFLCLLAFP